MTYNVHLSANVTQVITINHRLKKRKKKEANSQFKRHSTFKYSDDWVSMSNAWFCSLTEQVEAVPTMVKTDALLKGCSSTE